MPRLVSVTAKGRLVRGDARRDRSSRFERAGAANVDGYYAPVAAEEGAETLLTIDDDFDGLEDVSAKVILSADEFPTLNDYLGY